MKPNQIPCRSPELLRAYFEYKLPDGLYDSDCEKAALIKEIQPKQFCELLPLLGLGHENMKGQEQIIAQLQSDPQAIYGDDFFFEDIYDRVRSCLRAKGVPHDNLAVRAAQLAQAGRFRRPGFSEGVQTELKQIGVPNAYIDYLKMIRYVYPKAHILANVVRNLQLAWFYFNDPSVWRDI